MNIPIKSFILFLEHISLWDKLTDEQAGKLIKSLFHYVSENLEPDFDDDITLSLAFGVIQKQVDYCITRYKQSINDNYKW